MPVSVALLRGINVGGKNKMAMADLRALFTSLGFEDVQTFIQSGNVVFRHKQKAFEEPIETAIASAFAITAHVVVRSAFELRAVVATNPFSEHDPSFVHYGFAKNRMEKSVIAGLDYERFTPELAVIATEHVYLYLPGGMGKSKLAALITPRLKAPITYRNTATVHKLIELAAGL